MKASDLFVRCLEEEGVEYVFVLPGEENLDVIESLRTSRIEVVVTRHEQHAAFMAATYGRLSGRAGVCLATLGPGALNLITGIAYAQLCGMPLVAVTGQKGVKQNLQGKFQLVDVVGTFRPLTKWNTSIVAARAIPHHLRHAFKVAEEERPGAVHLELPEDIAAETLPEGAPQPRVRLRRPNADDKGVEQAVALIRGARHPIMILSAGANRKRVSKQLKQFVEKTGIYAVSTQMGKGVLSDEHPQSLFCLGIHKHDYAHSAIDAADLVITVGYSIIEYPPAVWNASGDKAILHIDFEAAEPDEYYNPTYELIGDISYSLWAIHSRIGELSFDKAALAHLRERIHAKLFEDPCELGYPPVPQQIVKSVRDVLGPEDIISLDNGIYKIWFARMYKTYAENTVLLDNGLATMGAGLAAAMAAKLIYPQRNALAICGDGGFLMNSQDLETAIRLKLNLVILLVRDDAYGFIRWKQQSEGLADFAMDIGNPDFVKYAEAYGASGLRLTEDDDLADLLRQAFAQDGVALIDCPVDYSVNDTLSQDLSLEVRHLVSEQKDDSKN